MRWVAILAALWCATFPIAASAEELKRALIIANQAYAKAVGPLTTPLADADLVKGALEAHRFRVDLVKNASRGEILAAIRRHAQALAPGGAEAVGLVYYAGHGASPEGSGRNFIIPVTAKDARSDALWDDSVELDLIRRRLARYAPSAAHIVVFDACRNELNLSAKALGDGSGRGFKVVPKGWGSMMLAFSTEPGRIALDTFGAGAHSPYATAFAAEMAKAASAGRKITAAELFGDIGRAVRKATGRQTPWLSQGAGRKVFFGKDGPKTAAATSSSDACSGDMWRFAEKRNTCAAYRAYLDACGANRWARFARAAMSDLKCSEAKRRAAKLRARAAERARRKDGPTAEGEMSAREQLIRATQAELIRIGYLSGPLDGGWGAKSRAALRRFLIDNKKSGDGDPSKRLLYVLRAAKPKARSDKWPVGKRFKACDACPEMIVVPGGSFMMGSPTSEPERESNEGPRRRVTIKKFAIGVYEVTFDEWAACARAGFCASNKRPDDFRWGRGRRPVINVSWDDITGSRGFIAWLNAKAGKRVYRLPSEAEWEYSARAGTDTPFWWGRRITPDLANYRGTSVYKGGGSKGVYRRKPLPVGAFKANPFGLFDVHGNVWELVQDCWNTSYSGGPTNGSAWMSGDCSSVVLRGGGWSNPPDSLRSAIRVRLYRSNRFERVGFRVARTLVD